MEASKLKVYVDRFNTLFDSGVRLAKEEEQQDTSRREFAHEMTVQLGSAIAAAEFLRDHCSAKLTAFMVETAAEPETEEWKKKKRKLLNEASQWRYAIAKEGAVFGDWNRPERAAVISGAAKYKAEIVKVEPKASAGRTKGKAKAETVETTPVEGSETQASIDITNLAAVLNVLIPIHTTAGLIEGLLQRCGLSDTQAGVLTVAMLDNHSAMLKRLADAACRDAAKGSKGRKAA